MTEVWFISLRKAYRATYYDQSKTDAKMHNLKMDFHITASDVIIQTEMALVSVLEYWKM